MIILHDDYMIITPCEENEKPLTPEMGKALVKYTIQNIDSIMEGLGHE